MQTQKHRKSGIWRAHHDLKTRCLLGMRSPLSYNYLMFRAPECVQAFTEVKSKLKGNLIPCKHIIFCMIPESAQVLHKSPNCFTPFPINLFPLGLKAVRFAMHLPTPCNTAKHRWQYMQTGTLTEIFTLWPQGLNGQPWYK